MLTKLHPSGNKYNTIVNGNQGKPEMFVVKLREKKDCPGDTNNRLRYLTKFDLYTKASALIL